MNWRVLYFELKRASPGHCTIYGYHYIYITIYVALNVLVRRMSLKIYFEVEFLGPF